jgi:hypothetical protein
VGGWVVGGGRAGAGEDDGAEHGAAGRADLAVGEAEEREGAVAAQALGERRDALVPHRVVVKQQRDERGAAARRRARGGRRAERRDGAEAAGQRDAALGRDLRPQ